MLIKAAWDICHNLPVSIMPMVTALVLYMTANVATDEALAIKISRTPVIMPAVEKINSRLMLSLSTPPIPEPVNKPFHTTLNSHQNKYTIIGCIVLHWLSSFVIQVNSITIVTLQYPLIPPNNLSGHSSISIFCSYLYLFKFQFLVWNVNLLPQIKSHSCVTE